MRKTVLRTGPKHLCWTGAVCRCWRWAVRRPLKSQDSGPDAGLDPTWCWCRSDADCADPTSVCNEATGRCQACDTATNDGCDEPHFCVSAGSPEGARRCDAASTDGGSSAGFLCVECVTSSQCPSDEPLCLAGECVECGANTDRAEPDASLCNSNKVCSPCTQDADCAHIPGLNVCDAGQCVECTGTNFDCGRSGGSALVCNSLTRTCSDQAEASSGNCQPCVSDDQCTPGRRCVMTQFDGQEMGYYCLWKEGDARDGAPVFCFDEGAPFIGVMREIESIDGDEGDYCRLITTTCQSYHDFARKPCDPDESVADQCGVPGLDDAFCKPFGTGGRCSYPCATADDCILGCTVGETPDFCEFQ